MGCTFEGNRLRQDFGSEGDVQKSSHRQVSDWTPKNNTTLKNYFSCEQSDTTVSRYLSQQDMVDDVQSEYFVLVLRPPLNLLVSKRTWQQNSFHIHGTKKPELKISTLTIWLCRNRDWHDKLWCAIHNARRHTFLRQTASVLGKRRSLASLLPPVTPQPIEVFRIAWHICSLSTFRIAFWVALTIPTCSADDVFVRRNCNHRSKAYFQILCQATKYRWFDLFRWWSHSGCLWLDFCWSLCGVLWIFGVV